jgi:hypothetical protein
MLADLARKSNLNIAPSALRMLPTNCPHPVGCHVDNHRTVSIIKATLSITAVFVLIITLTVFINKVTDTIITEVILTGKKRFKPNSFPVPDCFRWMDGPDNGIWAAQGN